MQIHPTVRKVIASTLIVTMSHLPILSYATNEQTDIDPFAAVSGQAQAFGDDLANSFKSNQGTVSGGVITVPSMKDGQFTMDGATQINANDLFGGSGAISEEEYNKHFPEGHEPDVNEYQAIFDSSDDMDKMGVGAKAALFEDANSDNPSIAGSAYKVLLDASNRSRPDFTNDPMLNLSRDTYDNIDLIAGGFGDCTTETKITESTIKTHLPEYERCQRVVDQSADCEITHNYDASIIQHYDGPYNLSQCGSGCTSLWIGRVGDNYWGGWCTIYEQKTVVKVTNPEAITRAVLEYAKWDDYMQVWIGPPGQEQKVWQGPNGNFPPETGGACELSTSWSRNPNVDVTRYFKNVEPGAIISFKIRVSVAGNGEGFGRIRINYDESKAVLVDEWTPQSCIDSARGVVDGFATGSITCTDNPSDSSGCTVLNGIRVCDDKLKESPLPGIPKLCKKVSVKADYDFYKGQLKCWTDPQGEEHCPVNTGGNLNSCKEYEDNPQCGFISSECINGAQGDSGTCYVFKDTYDCGTSVDVPTLDKKAVYQCGGPIRCMGDDCIDVSQSASHDFARAAALLNSAQFMTQDMACTGLDENGDATGNENVSCSAFSGEAGECKIAVGGVSDCCEKPKGISMRDYLDLIMAVPKIDGAITSLGKDNVIRSSYEVLRDPVMSGWSEATKPFTSYVDNISGAIDGFKTTVQDGINKLAAELKKEVSEIASKVYGAIADKLGWSGAASGGSGAVTGDAVADKASSTLAQSAGAWLSVASSIYTAYVVTITVIQMIYKCEEEELEMNSKRALKQCTYVGSYCESEVLGSCIEEREAYCCFNSPLSRIIQEQVRPQLNTGFGDPENPQCGGIPLDQIGSIDWDKVNLDEWLAILQSNGRFPNPEDISIESLTGSGSDFDTDGSRLNFEERTNARLDGLDADQVRRDAADMIKPSTGAYDVQQNNSQAGPNDPPNLERVIW